MTHDVGTVFAALAEPNRLALVEAIASGGRSSATALAAPMGVTRQAVDQHLRVLTAAGIVTRERAGREVLYALDRGPLDASASWLDTVAAAWDARLARIKRLAESAD